MRRFEVVKNPLGWQVIFQGRELARGNTKEEVIRAAANLAEGAPTTVRIHNADGSFDEERTYPRASDPRRSPG